MKRVLREAYRAQAGKVAGHVDLVIIAREPILELLATEGFKAVEDKLAEVLRKASLVSHKGERQKTS